MLFLLPALLAAQAVPGPAYHAAMIELAQIGDACDCIEVANVARTRDDGTEAAAVLGFQHGREPKRVVIVRASGAADIAGMMLSARTLSAEQFGATIVYAALYGNAGALLDETARDRGWTVVADLPAASLDPDAVRRAAVPR